MGGGRRNKLVGAVGAALLFVAAQLAHAQTRSDQDRDLRWLARPSGEVFAAMYPDNAVAQGVAGAVLLECVTRLDQRVDCAIIEESPAGWGFGPAALGVARSFRVDPAVRGGVAVPGEKFRAPVRFTQAGQMRTADDSVLPLWEAAPNHAVVQAALARYANGAPSRGRGLLGCKVKIDRTLDCLLVRESKSGAGFGRAALALAPAFKILESESDFIARHREKRFLLPINFGFAPHFTPVSHEAAEDAPLPMGEAPRALVDRIYPPAARSAALSGRVSILCTAREDLSFACKVSTETPTGHGFGAAALTLVNASVVNMAAGPDVSPFLEGDQIELTVSFTP